MEFQEKVGKKKDVPFLLKDKKSPLKGNPPARLKFCENYTFYGVTAIQKGTSTPEMAVGFKINKASGKKLFIKYHDIISPAEFDNDTIELLTPYIKITIKGKNIEPLFDYIGEHWLAWISEPTSDFIELKKGDKVVIESVEIEER